MEVAQEEVVTCVGICLLERLQRVAQRLREEEQMVDLLQYASLQALRRSFEIAVESKRGVSQLELLCEELSREEAAQKQRKEAKKQRRKKKRGKKESSCPDVIPRSEKDYDDEDEDEDEELKDSDENDQYSASRMQLSCGRSLDSSTKSKKDANVALKNERNSDSTAKLLKSSTKLTSVDSGEWEASRSPSCESYSCTAADSKHSSCRGPVQLAAQQTLFSAASAKKYVQESGYCSTNSSNLATPEGSDVACTEGLCNHNSGRASTMTNQNITY